MFVIKHEHKTQYSWRINLLVYDLYMISHTLKRISLHPAEHLNYNNVDIVIWSTVPMYTLIIILATIIIVESNQKGPQDLTL